MVTWCSPFYHAPFLTCLMKFASPSLASPALNFHPVFPILTMLLRFLYPLSDNDAASSRQPPCLPTCTYICTSFPLTYLVLTTWTCTFPDNGALSWTVRRIWWSYGATLAFTTFRRSSWRSQLALLYAAFIWLTLTMLFVCQTTQHVCHFVGHEFLLWSARFWTIKNFKYH